MIKIKTILLVFSLLFPVYTLSAESTIAVTSFINESDNPSYAFLSTTLAQTLSESLTKKKGIILVERSHIDKLLEEKSLADVGLIGNPTSTIDLSFIDAHYMIIGSYTGNGSHIKVTSKLVDISSSRIISQKGIAGTVEELFAQMEAVADHLYQTISSEKNGTITITSSPSGAKIFIDNIWVGRTPLTRHPLSAGNHTIRYSYKGYTGKTTTVSVVSDVDTPVHQVLSEVRPTFRTAFKIALQRASFIENYFKTHFYYSAGLEQSIHNWFLEFKFHSNTGTSLDHSYTIDLPGDSVLQEERSIVYKGVTASIGYEFFLLEDAIHIKPSIGVGYLLYEDRIGETGYYADYTFPNKKTYTTIHPECELLFFPKSAINLYVDLAYFVTSKRLDRTTVQSVSFWNGENYKVDKPFFKSFSVGVGLQFSLGNM